MASAFGWLDYSEAQRRQMLEVVDLFRDKGTLDELGFGSVRDAFSDHFFPGTSTIQTRARYLLFVPWLYLRIERDRVPEARLEKRAREDQAALALALQRGGEGEAQGVIGIQAGESLQRTPAAIYWTGLRRFRIWRFSGSIAQRYAAIRRAGSTGGPVRSDDDELVERTAIPGWDANLPKEPPDLLGSATLSLRSEDAEYLRERIVSEAPGSLLALCIDGTRRLSAVDYPWLHPGVAGFPPLLQAELRHAHRFSVAAYGAALLYNLMLAEMADAAGMPVGAGLVDQRRSQMHEWADETASGGVLSGWRMTELWSTVCDKGHAISYQTRQFIEELVAIMQADPRRLADNADARRAIRRRELALKGGLARLTHRRALERFTGSAGLYRQTYRWPNVKRIVGDIQEGLALREPLAEAVGA